MKTTRSGFQIKSTLILAILLAGARDARATAEPMRIGVAVDLGGSQATLQSLDTLPQVESDYTRRFKFDSFQNSKLGELRSHYHLDQVVASEKREFDRQVLLLDWTHRQFPRFGRPSTNAQGALKILQAVDEGHTFFCAQYAELMVSAAASLGWVDRPLALRRHQGVAQVGGSTEHSVTEIWSNQYRKWVMLDPTSNLHVEKEGVPLNAYEIREEWFYRNGTNLIFVIGREQKRYRKADLPVLLRHFEGFGDLGLYPDELDKYGFIGYIPNTDLMDSGYDYAGMFIVKDQLCDGTKWHQRTVPANPAIDPYFPVGQASMTLAADRGRVWIELKTLTPNFKGYEVQLDGAAWQTEGGKFVWNVHPGRNRIAVRTVNQFEVTGPESTAVLDLRK